MTHAAVAELLAATLLADHERGTSDTNEALADAGGSLRVTVHPEYLRVTGHLLADGVGAVLTTLARCLADPDRTAATLEVERRRLVQRVRVFRAQPRVAARLALLEHCFGTHPLAYEVPGAEAVKGVEDAQVHRLHRRQVTPAGASLVLIGDIETATACRLTERFLAGWPAAGQAARLPAPKPIVAGELLVVDHPGTDQAHVRLAAPALSRTDPGYAALAIANLVFAGYFSSRLVENLREAKGYIYRGASMVADIPGGAYLAVEFDSAAAVVGDAVAETRAEAAGLSGDRPPTEAEVTAARDHATGLLTLTQAGQAGMARMLAGLAEQRLGYGWLTKYTEALRRVSTEDVAAVAAKILAPEAFAGVVVGPREAILDGLRVTK